MATAEIRGKISLDGSQAKRGIEEVEKSVGRLSRTFNRITKLSSALFAFGMIKRAVNSVFDYSQQIRELALQYGITTDQAQKLLTLANQTGIPAATLANKFKEAGMEIGASVDKMEQLKNAAILTNEEIGNIQKLDSVFENALNKVKASAGKFFSWAANSDIGKRLFPQLAALSGLGSPGVPLNTNVEGKQNNSEWYDKMTSGGGVDKVASSRNMDVIANRANELQRIGAFSGVQNPILQINRQQLDELRKLNEKVAKGQFVLKDSVYL